MTPSVAGAEWVAVSMLAANARSEAAAALVNAQAVLGEITTDEADVQVALFSALKKSGVSDAAQVLHSWVHGGAQRAVQSP